MAVSRDGLSTPDVHRGAAADTAQVQIDGRLRALAGAAVADRGRKGNREWELRNRLTRSAARMHADHLDPMVEDLQALPKKIGGPILAAWNIKEDLMNLLALHGTHPNRSQVYDLLVKFYESAAASGLPEMERLASTVSTW